MKIVIVGGVAGGASAAARARRLSETAQIIVFERGPDVSFANCGLPYFIGGEIHDRDQLLVTKPPLLKSRYNLDVRTHTQIESIDRAAMSVRARNLISGQEYVETYDKLILATGAAPIRPPIPGIDLPGVFTLRNLEDMDRIKQVVDRGVRHAVVVGAGFIGLELVENLVRLGIAVTIVELQNQILPLLDREMTTPLVEQLESHSVALRLGLSAESITQSSAGLNIQLTSGEHLSAQLVLLGIGVRPENALALLAGLAVGTRGGIRVDEHMRTSDPDIYAVGDAIEVQSYVTGDPVQIPLAGPANRQGRIAAECIMGRDSRYRGSQGTAIVRCFDRVIAATGETEKALLRAGRPYRKIYVHPSQHAGYYPGSKPLSIKLLFEPVEGRILGAQVVGEEGVDTRIDVLAMAIQARMTVFDLEEAELAYAPQFGSAKDAINMAGFVATGLLNGDDPMLHADELATPEVGNRLLLDVRTHDEFAAGHIPNALNIPLDELRPRLSELPRDRSIVAYCQVGQRGYLATRVLRQAGFDALNLGGGYKTFQMFGLENHR